MDDKNSSFPLNDLPVGNPQSLKGDDSPVYRTEEVGASEGGQQATPLPPEPSSAVIEKGPSPIQSEPQDVSNMARLEEVSPKPKRRLLKPLLFVGLVLILIVLGFFALKFKPDNLGGKLFGKKGEIVWWGFREEEAVYRPIIEEYQKKNPNMKISYQKQSPTDYRERLTNALASGKGPDVFEMHNSWIPMFSSYLETAPQTVVNRDEFSKSFYPTIVANLVSDKGVLAVPLEFDALTLYINEDIFASSAKTPPSSWDELRSLAIELTQKDKETIIQSGVALGITENIDHWPEIIALMLLQNKANFASLTSVKVKDSLDFYSSFATKHRVWNKQLPPSTAFFAMGKVAMYFAPAYRAYEIAQINPNLKFRTIPLPQLPKNQPDDPDYSYATYWVQGVWNKSASKDIAWDFLKFLVSKDSLEMLNKSYKDVKGVERLYPRPEMNAVYKEHPILGSIMKLANSSKTWYLADATNDGESGINTKINNLYKSAISSSGKSLEQLNTELAKILSQYGLK